MVEFTCLRSGNKVAFSDPNDIESMRKHEGYKEVKNETNANETIEIPQAPKKEVLKRGRPRKVN